MTVSNQGLPNDSSLKILTDGGRAARLSRDAAVLESFGYSDVSEVFVAAPNITSYRVSKDSEAYFLKLASSEDEMAVLQLRAEWAILEELRSKDVPGVASPLAWQNFAGAAGIVYSASYGKLRTFREWYCPPGSVSQRPDVDWILLMKRLRLVCMTLQRCHALDIRHGNIRPDILLLDTSLPADDPSAVLVGSWLFSSRLAVESHFPTSAILDVSVSYIAPECTGRMNRSIDLRADLYSLGVTLYEIISQELPFQGSSTLEIMHKHISLTAKPLSDFVEIAEPIETLVMKLLSKNLEDRYQSAVGVLYDVERILESLQDSDSQPLSGIAIGSQDRASKFLVSSNFVGRSTELKLLKEQFDLVHTDSRTRVATIGGYSGIGKSRLVQEVLYNVSRDKAFYTECKFDQYKSFAPFAIISTLVRDLLAQIFVEPPKVLEAWRQRIQDSLGMEARAACEVCPDLYSLLSRNHLDTLPMLVPLGAMASEERLKRCLKRLIQCFATPETQLVIFVDDIQWSPPADLQILLSVREQSDMFIICAYRDNEVGPEHIVNTMFLCNVDPDLSLNLSALTPEDTTRIVAATLHRPMSRSRQMKNSADQDLQDLSELIFVKTQGNAFFITQILTNLYNSQLLSFDFSGGFWTWNLEAIKAIEISNDVIDLVIRRVSNLSPSCQEILQIASCLGNTAFRLDILEVTAQQSRPYIAKQLFDAMSAGLVVAVDDAYRAALALEVSNERTNEDLAEVLQSPHCISPTMVNEPSSESADPSLGGKLVVGYRFLHDKVQQAVHALIAEETRPSLQLHIGLSLLKSFGASATDSMLFDICSQINKGRLLLEPSKYIQMAELNLRAARTAFQNTANDTALELSSQAVKYLPEDLWSAEPELASRYFELCEEVYASKALYDEALVASATLLANSKDPIIQARMYDKQMKALMSVGSVKEALDVGATGLASVGIDLKRYLDGSSTRTEADEATKCLWDEVPRTTAAIHALKDLPLLEDPLLLAATDMLVTLLPSMFFLHPNLMPLMVLTGVKLSIEHGVANFSCYFMAFLGMIFCEIEDSCCDFRSGDAYNQVSEQLLDRLMHKSPQAVTRASAVLTLNGCVNAFTRDARVEGKRNFNMSIELSQRCFDGEYMAYSLGNQAITRFCRGENLSCIYTDLAKHIKVVTSYKRDLGTQYCFPTLQGIYTLIHARDRREALLMNGSLIEDMDESLRIMQAGDMTLHQVYFWTTRLLVALIFEDQRAALVAVRSGRALLPGAYGIPAKTAFETMSFVVLIEAQDSNEKLPEDLEDYLPILCKHISGWTRQSPKNFGAWEPFMQAELDKHTAPIETTIKRFEQAFDLAAAQENFLLCGIFGSRCARYVNLALGRRAASGYAREAVAAYYRFGSPIAVRYFTSLYDLGFGIENTRIPREAKDELSKDLAYLSLSGNPTNVTRPLLASKSILTNGSKNQYDATNVSASDATSKTRLQGAEQSFQPMISWSEASMAETDLNVVIQSSLLLSKSLQTEDIVRQLLTLLLQVAGAQTGVLITDLKQDQELFVAATASINEVRVYNDLALSDAETLVPAELIRLAANSKRCVIDEKRFMRSRLGRVQEQQSGLTAKSFMALPVILSDKILAVAYLAHDQLSGLFTERKVELLTTLASQAAVTLEKGRIYQEIKFANDALEVNKRCLEQQTEELEGVVELRTRQLQAQNSALSGEIKQRMAMEKELVEAKETAEQATAMKSRFLAMMSHEMRTPFNSVMGFATLLLDTPLTMEQQDMAQSIVDSSTDLISIINDILDFSKIENDKMNLDPIWFDLRSLVESTLEIVSRPASNKEIDLAYLEDPPTAADWVFADNSRLRQCVLNLLSNAVKFTPKHGSVSVTSELQKIRNNTDGSQRAVLSIIVQDTGIGISHADQSKLFQFFSQVDDSVTRRFGGTGLGLAISKKICQLFEGDLTCVSEEGKGSTFTATFKVTIDRESHPPEVMRAPALLDKKCLILERSELLQLNLQQHLNLFGIKWTSRSSLDSITPDMALCDFAIIGDSFNQPETMIALRQMGVSVHRLPILVLMPFGATLPQQPDKKDLDSIDAVVSAPVRRVRLFRSLQSLYPTETGVVPFAKPTIKNLKTIANPGDCFPRKDITILLVEDNMINIKVATQLLKRCGYIPKVAHDGLQAVAACASEHFDLIFMDLSMPKMGGLEATRGIRAAPISSKRPYICAMTANAMSGDKEKCLEADMDDYVSKPATLNDLSKIIAKARDIVVGTVSGNEHIEHVDHDQLKNPDELAAATKARRQSLQQLMEPDDDLRERS